MPRLNNGLEVFKQLDSVIKYVIQTGTIGDTLTTSATTAGGTGANVTALTNFSAADPAFLTGSGGTELVTLGTPATTPMPMGQTLIVHPIGTRLVEAQAINLGHMDEAGLDFGGQLTLNPVKAATSRTPIAYLADPGEFSFSFNLLGWNNLNVLTAFGITESAAEVGSGVAATPYGVQVSGSNIGNQSALMGLRFSGVNLNAQTIQIDLMGAQVAVNVSAKVGASSPAVLTISGKYTNFLQRIWA
jgi:hypothetical protein